MAPNAAGVNSSLLSCGKEPERTYIVSLSNHTRFATADHSETSAHTVTVYCVSSYLRLDSLGQVPLLQHPQTRTGLGHLSSPEGAPSATGGIQTSDPFASTEREASGQQAGMGGWDASAA